MCARYPAFFVAPAFARINAAHFIKKWHVDHDVGSFVRGKGNFLVTETCRPTRKRARASRCF
jgi:hypothetical protein